jgi:malate dehydrogenase (oxaloacetate-decarboxylating)
LQDIGISVFHDDQHGTAIVVLAALINAAKLDEQQNQEKHMTASDLFIKALAADGVEYIFGIPGGRTSSGTETVEETDHH